MLVHLPRRSNFPLLVFPLQTFLDFFFCFFVLFFRSLSICTRYAGLRVIYLDHELRYGRIRIVYEEIPNQRYIQYVSSIFSRIRPCASSGLGFQFYDAGNETLLFST
jgi:hypothetical protein